MNPSQLVKFRLKKDFNAQTEKWSGIRASAGGYVRQRRMLCYTILVGPISRSPNGDNNGDKKWGKKMSGNLCH